MDAAQYDLECWISKVPPITLEKGNRAHEEFVAGRAKVEGRRLDLGVSHYREALRLQPRFPEAHFCLGSVCVTLALLGNSMTHWEDAGRHFDLALSQGASWPEVYLRVAQVRFAVNKSAGYHHLLEFDRKIGIELQLERINAKQATGLRFGLKGRPLFS